VAELMCQVLPALVTDTAASQKSGVFGPKVCSPCFLSAAGSPANVDIQAVIPCPGGSKGSYRAGGKLCSRASENGGKRVVKGRYTPKRICHRALLLCLPALRKGVTRL
jgi:hypothetical protein